MTMDRTQADGVIAALSSTLFDRETGGPRVDPGGPGDRAYEAMDALLNRASRAERERFVARMALEEHRTLQQSFMREIIRPYLTALAALQVTGHTDLRNEAAAEAATRMVEATRDIGLPLI